MPCIGCRASFLRLADGFRHVIFDPGIHLQTSRPLDPSRILLRSTDPLESTGGFSLGGFSSLCCFAALPTLPPFFRLCAGYPCIQGGFLAFFSSNRVARRLSSAYDFRCGVIDRESQSLDSRSQQKKHPTHPDARPTRVPRRPPSRRGTVAQSHPRQARNPKRCAPDPFAYVSGSATPRVRSACCSPTPDSGCSAV